MSRFTVVAILLAQLIAISLACFHGGISEVSLAPYYKYNSNSGDRTVGLEFKASFGRKRRSIENETLHSIDISRKLFTILDINSDDQLDVKEWFDEGGEVRSYSDMIGDHDNNSDEMISLEEFFAIPVDPAVIGAIEQMIRSDQNQ